MKFYCISRAETGPFQYAWADGYGPIDHMPFFESFSDELKQRKSSFWRLNKSRPGITVDRGGSKWSDILGCGGGPPGEFFSERVIMDLKVAGIPFYRCTRMPITQIRSNRLREVLPPNYFVIEAAPGMKIRSESVPMEEQIAARNERPPSWISPFRMFAALDTWNGADLFSPSHGKSLFALFCSERVKELAECQGWTNIDFVPLEPE